MSTPRAYQRVNTATDYDYDFSKFPPFVKFDGVDDSLYSAASVDFTSTDKMTVFAGVHKASDAALGMVLEHSAELGTNAGTFQFYTNASPYLGYDFASFGTAASLVRTPPIPAPATSVISLVTEIATDTALTRHNGVQVASSAGDQGTGNYGNYPLYVGRRNNASLPFNGRLYQLAIKGKALSAGEVATVEALINARTKAF